MAISTNALSNVIQKIMLCLYSGFFLAVLDAQSENQNDWSDIQFPSYIKRLNHFGERPDWSHDGKNVLFAARTFGDVYEIDIATGSIMPLTHHYYHGDYLRALNVNNRDILLVGQKSFPWVNWQEARFRLTELWVLSKNLDSAALRLGE